MKTRIRIFIVIAMLLTICITGCQGRTHESSRAENQSTEKLRVFYVKGSTALNLLVNFEMQHPEIELETHEIFVGDSTQIQEAIEKYGEPDLILGGEYSGADLIDWKEKGYISSMSDLLSQDTDISIEDYFPGTFDIFSDESGLYALPMGIEIKFMTMQEGKWAESEFSKLPSGYTATKYTAEKLIEALAKEVEKVNGKGKMFCCDTTSYPMDWLYRTGGIEETENGYEIDPKLFSMLYSYEMRNHAITKATKDYYRNELGKEYKAEEYHFVSGMDPRIYEGNFVVSDWSIQHCGAPQICQTYGKSVNNYYEKPGMKVIYIPSIDGGEEYGGEVTVFGCIGEKSKNKEKAYEVLRLMMDMENEIYSIPYLATETSYLPIGRDQAMHMVEEYQKEEGELTLTLGTGNSLNVEMERVKLSEEEIEELEKVIRGICYLYCADTRLVEANEICMRYYEAEMQNWWDCYKETMELLNQDVEGWQGVKKPKWAKTEELETEEGEDLAVDNEVLETLKSDLSEKEVGEEIIYGKYEQDGNEENGAENIKWIVLEKEEGRMLLLSKYCLNAMAYNPEADRNKLAKICDWNRSSIYQLLHGEFKENSFTEEEKALILLSEIDVEIRLNEGPPDGSIKNMRSHGTIKDGVTTSEIFLLSDEEVMKYLPNPEDRIAYATEYARKQSLRMQEGAGGIEWWLRTKTGVFKAKKVEADGQLQDAGLMIIVGGLGVRPAMWVDIS